MSRSELWFSTGMLVGLLIATIVQALPVAPWWATALMLPVALWWFWSLLRGWADRYNEWSGRES